MQKVDHFLKTVEKAFITCSWGVTIFVTFLIVTDVILRFVFNSPLAAAWEISEVLMPYIVLFGLAHTLTTGGHVRVSIVTDRLSIRTQIILTIFGGAISFLLCAFMTYWSWVHFWDSFRIREEMLAAIRIPWWIGKVGMPLAFGMLTIRYLINLLSKIDEILNPTGQGGQ
jgi:TRAP-type C4-dicarboxylate transport system permease small subunit